MEKKKQINNKKENLGVTPEQWEKAAPEICENIRRVNQAAKEFQEERKKEKKKKEGEIK